MRLTAIRSIEDPLPLPSTTAFGPEPWARSTASRHRLKSGEIIDVDITSVTLTFAGRPAALVTALDVTDRTKTAAVLDQRTSLIGLTADAGTALNRPRPLRECLGGCVRAAVERLDLASAHIWTADQTGAFLEHQGGAGTYIPPCGPDRRVAIGVGRIGEVGRIGLPCFGDQVAGDTEFDECEGAKRAGIAAFAAYPLLVESRVVGVMAIFARRPLPDAILTGVAAIADLIALGIERHRGDDARRLLSAIVEASGDAIIRKTMDGTIVSWNAGAERLYGYPASEAIGRHISVLAPRSRAEEPAMLLHRVSTGAHVNQYETVRQHKSGSLIPVSLTLSPIKDAAGEIRAVSVIARDIGDAQRAARTLRESEERFRLVAETITQVFWIADVDTATTIYISPAYEQIWGRTCESLYRNAQSFLDAVHPEDREQVVKQLRLQRGGEPFSHEYRIRRPDGEVRWIRDRAFPVRNHTGRVLQYVGIAEDITEHRAERLLAEGALRNAEERMRFALDAAGVGVWETSFETGIAYMSPTCEQMHGLEPGAFAKTFAAFAETIHPEDRARVLDGVEKATAAAQPNAEMEYRTVWADGTVHRISAVGQFVYGVSHVAERGAGIAVDITERHLLEEQLRQSQKMDAIGRLAGGIAHDFNNLLTAILGFSGFLAKSIPDTDVRRGDVEEIRNAANRAAELTRQLLAFSRKQILAVRVIRLGDVVADITPMLGRLLGESIHLTTNTAESGLVNADPGQIEQVIVNLCVNAHYAMQNGGRLTIDTADVMLDEVFARHHPSVRPGPHVMLAVSDTGHGIDVATGKRIFEPFFTTKPPGQGTGLGLATVYGIVKQSGGSIWMSSEVDAGATFKIYLPRTDEVAVIGARTTPEAAPRGGTETILLVEDEDQVRAYVHRVLTAKGYTVHMMPDPQSAIDFAASWQGRIDLVFTDVILPGMSGRAMITHLQQCRPQGKVLYMSGYDDHAIVHSGVLEPGTAFLPKPFTGDALARKVREVLDAR
jgi:PAS domain S-box-containing protein